MSRNKLVSQAYYCVFEYVHMSDNNGGYKNHEKTTKMKDKQKMAGVKCATLDVQLRFFNKLT